MSNYIKPDIAFQSLNLASSVSTGCEIHSNSEPAACPVPLPDVPGLTIFPDESICMAYVPGYEDSLCYHVPVADSNIFES